MASPRSADDSKQALDNLVRRLKEAREHAAPKITQAELAKRLGKRHQSQIAKIEQGEHKLNLDDFVRWARIVGEDPIELLKEFEEDLEHPRRMRVHLR